MARPNPQNASLSFPRRAQDNSSATLALSYTGGVTAQSAVDYAADLSELTTSSLEMQSGKTPRSVPSGYPSRTRGPAHLAAFPGDLSFSSSANYVLTANAHIGQQNSSTEHRQSIDLSSEHSRSTLHFRQDHPWTPLDAAEDFSQVASTTAAASGSNQPPRTPFRTTDPYTHFQNSGFHDSAIGTLTHDERQSLASSPLAEMDDHYSFEFEIPSQPQDVLREEDLEGSEPNAEPESYHQQQHRPKPQRQPHTKEQLTCDVCDHLSKTPSDHKKHKARHEAPHTCQVTGCPRSVKGFATVNDLNRHEKSVHGKNARNSKSYKCFAHNCAKAEKVWPRLDNFKQHLVRMHPKSSVDELVSSSIDWYEQSAGSSGMAQSAAVAGVLHSQEEAARGPSQKGKRRRNSSPPTEMPAQKRPTVNRLYTRELQEPPQDHTRLSPMSAYSKSRSPQLVRQPLNQQDFVHNVQNVPPAHDQDLRLSQQSQAQRLGRDGPAFVPSRRVAAQGHNTLPLQEQSVTLIPFVRNDLSTLATTAHATQSAVDQQSQFQESPAHDTSHQRAWTAPETDDYNSHVRLAFLEETHPMPPGQDDSHSILEIITGWDIDTTVPRCTPDTSNEPTTPVQPGQVPNLIVNNESEDEKGEVEAAKDLFAEELRSWIHEHGFERKERQRLVANGDLGPFYLSLAKKSTRGSASDVGTSHKSTSGCTPPKAGKTNHICPTCQKKCLRQSELKKHEKRHSRPYGCVLDNCYKRFGSKNDLKRHERTHPEQQECYRCDGNHRGQDGNPCRKVWYGGRDIFKQHIRTCVSSDPNQIERKANECRIPANNVGRFWCGFCVKIVNHNGSSSEAPATYRLSHIDSHFSEGRMASDWIELGGNGDTKAQVERKQNITKNEQIEARERGGQTIEEHGTSSTSSDSQTDSGQHDSTAQSQPQQHPIHQGQMLERQLSNATQYRQQMLPQQLYKQRQQQQASRTQQISRAKSSSQLMQQAMKVAEPAPTQRYNDRGQVLASQAECCQCKMQYLLELGRICATCDHPLCQTCKKR